MFITISNYKPSKGSKASKLPTRRELVGYVSMEKRITSLMSAGIRTAMHRDDAYYDSLGDSDFRPPVPLPRHLPADLAEVSELAREYSLRRAQIEERVRSLALNKATEPVDKGKASDTPPEAPK